MEVELLSNVMFQLESLLYQDVCLCSKGKRKTKTGFVRVWWGYFRHVRDDKLSLFIKLDQTKFNDDRIVEFQVSPKFCQRSLVRIWLI